MLGLSGHQRAAGVRIGIARVADDRVVLVEAVLAQGVLVQARLVPVVEDARAGPHRRLVALERRPGHARARRDVHLVVDERLRFVAGAERQQQVLLEAVVVLDEQAGLGVAVLDVRVARADRVVVRTVGLVQRHRRERERAGEVAQFVADVVAGLQLEAGAQAVLLAERDVEVVGHLEFPEAASALDLRAAVGELILHANRRRVARRVGLGLLPGVLHADLVEVLLRERADVGHAHAIGEAFTAVAARLEVEVADAEVLRAVGVAIELEAQRVGLGEDVLDVEVDVEPIGRLVHQAVVGPVGVVATIVCTSYSLLLRTFSEKPVRPLTIGPSIDQP